MIFHILNSPPELLFRVLPSKICQETVLKCLDRVTKTINKLPSVFTFIWVNTHVSLSLQTESTLSSIFRQTFYRASSVQFSSAAQSCPTLQPHGLQHNRLPCPSPTPRVYSNSCPSHRWCHSTISFSVILFSSHLQSFTTSGSFPMSQFFPSGGKSIGVSVSASVLPINIKDWFPLGWTGWISMQSKGLSRIFSTPQFKSINFSVLSFLYSPTLTSILTTGKSIALPRQTFVDKVMSPLFNMLSRLVIAYLPRSKRLLISWLQSPSAVILEPPGIVSHCFHCFPIYLPWSDGTSCHDLSSLNVEF